MDCLYHCCYSAIRCCSWTTGLHQMDFLFSGTCTELMFHDRRRSNCSRLVSLRCSWPRFKVGVGSIPTLVRVHVHVDLRNQSLYLFSSLFTETKTSTRNSQSQTHSKTKKKRRSSRVNRCRHVHSLHGSNFRSNPLHICNSQSETTNQDKKQSTSMDHDDLTNQSSIRFLVVLLIMGRSICSRRNSPDSGLVSCEEQRVTRLSDTTSTKRFSAFQR